MNIVKSSVDGLERFNPSNAERFRLPSAAQALSKLLQTATTSVNTACPSSATLL